MKLTAKQIKQMDEISLDKVAIKKTLDIALQFHANRMNEIAKDEKEFWDELFEIHSLDPEIRWIIKKKKGAVIIEKLNED